MTNDALKQIYAIMESKLCENVKIAMSKLQPNLNARQSAWAEVVQLIHVSGQTLALADKKVELGWTTTESAQVPQTQTPCEATPVQMEGNLSVFPPS